jgi:hypothetical protein
MKPYLLLATAIAALSLGTATAQGVIKIPASPRPAPQPSAEATRQTPRPSAQPTPSAGSAYSFCREAGMAIDDSLREAGYTKAQDIGDDSAPRATMRAARITAEMAAIQANITLMIANHCPLPDLPMSSSVYEGAAIECVLARDTETVKAKCDRATWLPGPRWLAAKRPQ